MPASLLDYLLQQFPTAKRQTLKRMVEAGRVRVNAIPATRLSQRLKSHDQISIHERRRTPKPRLDEPLSPQIIFEDPDILIVNKPPGLLTSTVPAEPRPTLLAQVRAYLASHEPRARVGLIHRLDRDACGLLVFSKNDEAYRSLKSQFFHHTVKREYRAVVHGVPDPPEGCIETRLVERADGTVHSTRQYGKGGSAITRYAILKTVERLSLLRVTLETGRKHQIRVHLVERGTPVVGDRLYGAKGKSIRLMLAATKLTIVHPRTAVSMTFRLPLPQEFPIQER